MPRYHFVVCEPDHTHEDPDESDIRVVHHHVRFTPKADIVQYAVAMSALCQKQTHALQQNDLNR